MKKIAKLSLVAAVAVAGFTSANAQSLEEAIKGVETSGSVVYRYNDYNNDVVGKESAQTNNYKIAANLASKVNEDVKLNTRFIVGNGANSGFAQLGNNTNTAANNTSDIANKDTGADITLSNVYFGYTGLKNTTVNVGKQGLTTPWTVAVDSDNNEQNGTGILALSTVGPVTLAGAFFNQTNLDASGDAVIAGTTSEKSVSATSLFKGDEDIATVGAIVAAGPVTLDAWYLDAQDIFDTYTIGAKSNFEVSSVKLGVDARYASLTPDDGDTNSMAKIALTAKAGIVDGKIAYAMTDKDGGLTALDNDATTTLLGWNITSNGKTDADYWQAVAGVDILSNLNLSANYGDVKYVATNDSTKDMEEEEIYAQLLYKMSKNLTSYVRYGTYTKEIDGAATKINDDTRGRLQVEYTF
jgi:hypothetical protein